MTSATAPPPPRYALRRPSGTPASPPRLDRSQQAVVAHDAGPLLVLAGPGTGKTTTMVEAVVDLVGRRGVRPEEVLALTFSRKAAEQLRDRVTARLGRTLGTPLASTFHSFAYALLRHHGPALTPDAPYAEPLRLLSAAQQDVVLRDLLRPSEEAVRWPDELASAVGTRGFAAQLRELLARARERGLTAEDLAAAGLQADRPAWVAAGQFLEQYLAVLDAQSALDYADLVQRAVALAESPEVRADLRRRYSWVFVDEYQDTDPGQVALLQALAGDGRNLVAVGDPDQSIYGFRGAEVRGILDFPAQFPTAAGTPAPVVALQTTRRFGPVLLEASRRVVSAVPTAGAIPATALKAFREPLALPGPCGDGRVEVLHLDSERAEAEHVADLLRRAHLADGLPWSDMAVLVRNGRSGIPALRRALVTAGVPVEVAADDTPLTAEPAVRHLLAALSAALRPDDGEALTDGEATALLTSPLGGLDAADLRLLARALHRAHRRRPAGRQQGPGGIPPGPTGSVERLHAALLDPHLLEALVESERGGTVGRAARLAADLGALLRRVRDRAASGDSAEEVLWELWDGTPWPRRLRAAATSGGPGAAAAHRDLDAVCALFDEAARAEERRGHTSIAVFLDTLAAQELPADTLAERGVRGEAVRMLTAHRSKGLEWRLVVVAQVQEGVWPDLRRRSTLLGADELGADGPLPPVPSRTLLAEERRLFYVACTRARERLLVTAVASPEEDGDQPSRFTHELGVAPRRVTGRPPRPLSADGLVADLRRALCDPDSSPALRAAAARRLARLASPAGSPGAADGRRRTPLAPAADPARWWGLRPVTVGPTPVRAPDQPVSLSPSALEAIATCPAKWFLEREAAAATEPSAAQGFGQLVHAIADRLASRADPELETLGVEDAVERLMTRVDEVWPQLRFRTPWSAPRERAEVAAALRRLLEWHRAPRARDLLATEHRLDAEVELAGGERVHLHGYADRLELDAERRVVVVDLKTGKRHPTRNEVADHAQLALYQLAVAHGAVDDLAGPDARPGGAELVQLRCERPDASAKVQRQEPPDPDAPPLLEPRLADAVRRLRDEDFAARPGGHCRHCQFTALCPARTPGTVLS